MTAAKKKTDKKTRAKNKPGPKKKSAENRSENKEQAEAGKEARSPQKSEAEIMAELRRVMAETPVYEFVTQFMSTLSSLAYQRLGVYQESEKVAVDLEQARTAIDCYEALLKLVADKINKEEAGALKNVLSGLQLTFVKQKQQK